ncbi:MAG: hypothetical protein IT445_18160 [Phycisphaeraceae bacterium]|nr:hypothetical protein [Phycisphaeraceae bacterium]
MSDNKRPIKVITAKGGVEAAIWPKNRNGAPPGRDFEVRISKCYRDATSWRNTNRFHVDDLLKVAAVAEEAYRYLAVREIEPAGRGATADG